MWMWWECFRHWVVSVTSYILAPLCQLFQKTKQYVFLSFKKMSFESAVCLCYATSALEHPFTASLKRSKTILSSTRHSTISGTFSEISFLFKISFLKTIAGAHSPRPTFGLKQGWLMCRSKPCATFNVENLGRDLPPYCRFTTIAKQSLQVRGQYYLWEPKGTEEETWKCCSLFGAFQIHLADYWWGQKDGLHGPFVWPSRTFSEVLIRCILHNAAHLYMAMPMAIIRLSSMLLQCVILGIIPLALSASLDASLPWVLHEFGPGIAGISNIRIAVTLTPVWIREQS